MGRIVAVGHQNVGRLQISVSDISVVQVRKSQANVLGNFILKGTLFEVVTCVDEVKIIIKGVSDFLKTKWREIKTNMLQHDC